jgi:hypothetical protein
VFANSYRPCFKSRLHCVVQAVRRHKLLMSATTENFEQLVTRMFFTVVVRVVYLVLPAAFLLSCTSMFLYRDRIACVFYLDLVALVVLGIRLARAYDSVTGLVG